MWTRFRAKNSACGPAKFRDFPESLDIRGKTAAAENEQPVFSAETQFCAHLSAQSGSKGIEPRVDTTTNDRQFQLRSDAQ